MCVCVVGACAHSTHVVTPWLVLFSPQGSPTTHHPSGPGQPNAGAGGRVAAEVPGVWRARAHCHLEEKRTQSGREGPPLLPAGARQPSDPEHQGSGSHCSGRGGDSSLGGCADCFYYDSHCPVFFFFIVVCSSHWLSPWCCTVS